VLAYLNKQAQIRSQLRTRSKQEIEAQLAFYLSAVTFLSMLASILCIVVSTFGDYPKDISKHKATLSISCLFALKGQN
jgi:hypothetical protein